jgi:hypothetical protein
MKTMDEQTTIKGWRKFAVYMEKQYLPNTIPKYGDSRLEDVTSQETRYWNIIRYATRLMAGRGKRHDLEKIVHYAQMAWEHERKESGKRGKLCAACKTNVAMSDSALCGDCMLQSGENDGRID